MSLRTIPAMLFAASAALLPLAALAVPRAGDVAPPFSLKRADTGAPQTLAALKGKPVYLNFFASWCGPCNEEAPSVVKLYKEYHPRGLVTLGVNGLESKDKALEFAKKYGVPFEIVLDDNGGMAKNYGAIALPVHVFIDRKGIVSTYRLGEMSPAEIEAAIKKII
jgi:cytochrome c biogenesis protein CcmG/thiol:disulfide interchange protein DsbE